MTDSLPIARYRFSVRLNATMRLPEYAGSMLRGGFGHALRNVACLTRQKDCQGCPLQTGCAYLQVFNPIPPTTQQVIKLSQIPVPYVIEPPSWGERILEQGETFQFNMVLIGSARAHLSLIILAWQRAWLKGFSKHQVTGTLAEVAVQTPQGWTSVFTDQEPVIREHDDHLTLGPPPQQEEAQLTLETPLRIQHNGKPLGPDRLTGRHLLVHLTRRCELIKGMYFPGDPVDFRTLAAQAEEIHSQPEIRWRDWSRYSNRQQQSMALGGVIGQWRLSGDLTAFNSYLQLGQWLHIGKNTSFGLGRYHLNILQ